MKIFFMIILLLFCGLAYAENRVYVDNSKQLEVVDLSGLKTLEQINAEFKGNFIEVTTERKVKEEADKIVADELSAKKDLIATKLRELAIKELKFEGKL